MEKAWCTSFLVSHTILRGLQKRKLLVLTYLPTYLIPIWEYTKIKKWHKPT